MKPNSKRARAKRAILRRCPVTTKRRFRDHRETIAALQQAANIRERASEDGVETRRHEFRSYECNACNGWHLTSQTVWFPSRPRDTVLQSI